MTTKVAKLQRACLSDPVKVEVATKYSTVDTLRQQYLFIPAKYKVDFDRKLGSVVWFMPAKCMVDSDNKAGNVVWQKQAMLHIHCLRWLACQA